MKLSAAILVCFAGGMGCGGSAAADECLSAPELLQVGRMASIMAVGAAVQRCGACLGPEKYQQTLANYESAGLLKDFWNAQKKLDASGPVKNEYIDNIVRQSARTYTAKLSGECDACRKTASAVEGLSSAQEREKLYAAETNDLTKSPGLKTCP